MNFAPLELVVLVATLTFAGLDALTLTPFGEMPVAVATFVKLLVTAGRTHVYVLDWCGASVPMFLSQLGESGSVTVTLCRATSPVFVTLIVKCASP